MCAYIYLLMHLHIYIKKYVNKISIRDWGGGVVLWLSGVLGFCFVLFLSVLKCCKILSNLKVKESKSLLFQKHPDAVSRI